MELLGQSLSAKFVEELSTVILSYKSSSEPSWAMQDPDSKTNRAGDDGSATKSTCYSHRGPGFGSQYPQHDSQPPVTPIPGNLIPSSDLCCWAPAPMGSL